MKNQFLFESGEFGDMLEKQGTGQSFVIKSPFPGSRPTHNSMSILTATFVHEESDPGMGAATSSGDVV